MSNNSFFLKKIFWIFMPESLHVSVSPVPHLLWEHDNIVFSVCCDLDVVEKLEYLRELSSASFYFKSRFSHTRVIPRGQTNNSTLVAAQD